MIHKIKNVLSISEMSLQWALDVMIFSFFVFEILFVCLNVDFYFSWDQSELTINHSDEIFDVILVYFLVVNYDFDLITRRSSTDNNTQTDIRAVRWFNLVWLLCVRVEWTHFSYFIAFNVVFSSRDKCTDKFFTFLLGINAKFKSWLNTWSLLCSWRNLRYLGWSSLLRILLHDVCESTLRSGHTKSCTAFILLLFDCWEVLITFEIDIWFIRVIAILSSHCQPRLVFAIFEICGLYSKLSSVLVDWSFTIKIQIFALAWLFEFIVDFEKKVFYYNLDRLSHLI